MSYLLFSHFSNTQNFKFSYEYLRCKDRNKNDIIALIILNIENYFNLARVSFTRLIASTIFSSEVAYEKRI